MSWNKQAIRDGRLDGALHLAQRLQIAHKLEVIREVMDPATFSSGTLDLRKLTVWNNCKSVVFEECYEASEDCDVNDSIWTRETQLS